MITRISIDNYKLFVNFEMKPSNISLIMGRNGTGKSTLFEVLTCLQYFVSGRSPVSIFSDSTLTWWQNSLVQSFELDITGNGGIYTYKLQVEHQTRGEKQRLLAEEVYFDSKLIYKSDLADVQLFRDDFTEGPSFSKDWSQSGLPFLGNRGDNTRVTWLKEWFQNLLVVKLVPPIMKGSCDESEDELDSLGRNFVGWYRSHVANDMKITVQLYDMLKESIVGFEGISIIKMGDVYRFLVKKSSEIDNQIPRFKESDFTDLSDGERSLIALHAILLKLQEKDTVVCLDEPDNYIALQEIQPWILNLKEIADNSLSQALIISHHPESMNLLAEMNGFVFNRHNEAYAKVMRFEGADGLLPSDMMALGDVE